MYEKRRQPMLSRREFVRRVLLHAAVALGIVVGSLAIGMIGYGGLAGLSFVDAFLNAAMILGGMGPVDPLPTDAAKVFAGTYALFSGVVFLIVAGVVFAPIFHRILHSLHLDDE